MERVKGIEPSSSAWKAVALPLSYTRIRRSFGGLRPPGLSAAANTLACQPRRRAVAQRPRRLVGEVGLEPTKAKPADLQSAPFAARDTPPAVRMFRRKPVPDLIGDGHRFADKNMRHSTNSEIPRPALQDGAVVMVTASRSVNRSATNAADGKKIAKALGA